MIPLSGSASAEHWISVQAKEESQKLLRNLLYFATFTVFVIFTLTGTNRKIQSCTRSPTPEIYPFLGLNMTLADARSQKVEKIRSPAAINTEANFCPRVVVNMCLAVSRHWLAECLATL